MDDLQGLVEQADHAALLRAVDGLCATREWDRLVTLGARCRAAVELGHQLWGVAEHIEYRLALEAPPAYAAAVLRPGAGRFTLGPLTEVAAGAHTWADLAPHLDDPIIRASVAQERALRGENLRGEPDLGREAAPPPALADWEPRYALPAYKDREAAFPQPDAAIRPVPIPGSPGDSSAAEPRDDDDAVSALRALTEVWVSQSSGTHAAVVVDGDAAAAVATLRAGRPGAAGLLRLEPAEALAVLQWCGASGGAYGRRPGGASGRFAAWWAAAALAGLDWPDDPADAAAFTDELGAALAELHWYRWAGPEAETGWTLRIAVADPVDGLAWAVEGTDRRDDEDDDDDGGGPSPTT